MQFESTPTLKIAYEEGGPSDGLPVILLHGWPDDVRTYDRVVPDLSCGGISHCRALSARLRRYVLFVQGDNAFW